MAPQRCYLVLSYADISVNSNLLRGNHHRRLKSVVFGDFRCFLFVWTSTKFLSYCVYVFLRYVGWGWNQLYYRAFKNFWPFFCAPLFLRSFCPFLTSNSDLKCWEHSLRTYHLTFLKKQRLTKKAGRKEIAFYLTTFSLIRYVKHGLLLSNWEKNPIGARICAPLFFTILRPLVKIDAASYSQLHALSFYHFTFWVRALYWRRSGHNVRLSLCCRKKSGVLLYQLTYSWWM
jgi:hypothetical protein